MLFNSMDFLIFFPSVTVFYYRIPFRFRYLWLLAASYYFYMCWNVEYALLILFSTIVTYGSAQAILSQMAGDGLVRKKGASRSTNYVRMDCKTTTI